jgi:hypothetical protein
VYTYSSHYADGSDAGQTTYSVLIKPGEKIVVNGRRFGVLDVVPFEEEDVALTSGCYSSKRRSSP